MLAPVPLVCVIWEDAHGDVNNESNADDLKREFHKPYVYHTFGLCIVDNEVGVSLVNDFCPDDKTYRGRSFIPRGMIREVIKLGTPKKRAERKKKEVANDSLGV